MSKRELIGKIEQAYKMVIAVGGRMFRIVRDEDDRLTIAEPGRGESGKSYTDTNQMINRFRIDGNPLRDYVDSITILEYTALLDA